MSAGNDHDLTGRWIGIFNYPDGVPPNQFEAVLRDAGGLISGLTTEPDDALGGGATLHAVIEGHREGSALSFTKVYDELDPEPVIIFYSGTVDAAGNEIEGRWDRDDLWSGTFLMIRQSGASEETEMEMGAQVPAGQGLP